MSTPVLVLVFLAAALAVGEFLLFGALAEAYRDIRQLRELSGVVDRPTPVDLGAAVGAPASSIGLPDEADSAAAAMALFVDSRCTTCRGIVSNLAGHLPDTVFLTAIAPSPPEAMTWLVQGGGFDLQDPDISSRILIASPDQIRERLGVEITPLAIDIEHGRLVRASTVPSIRQFYNQIPPGYSLPVGGKQGALT